RSLALAAVAVVAHCGIHRAVGATDVWTGIDSAANTNSNWSDPCNWGGSVVASGDILNFSGVNTVNNNDLTGYSFAGITFNSGAGSFNLSGNAITFGPMYQPPGANFPTGGLINNSTSAESLGLGLTLASGNETIATGSGSGVLTVGSVSRGANATVQFTQGGGNIVLSGLS